MCLQTISPNNSGKLNYKLSAYVFGLHKFLKTSATIVSDCGDKIQWIKKQD